MQEFLLIHPLIMCLLATISAFIEYRKGRIENGFSRLIIGMWFGWVFFRPDIDTFTQRVVGRWVVGSLLLVEVLSSVVYWYFKKVYRHALLPLGETDGK